MEEHKSNLKKLGGKQETITKQIESFGLGLSQDSRQTTSSIHSPLTSPVKDVSSWL